MMDEKVNGKHWKHSEAEVYTAIRYLRNVKAT